MAPQYIFLDTNNWIYLANGFNVLSKEHDDLHFRVFDIIEKRVDDVCRSQTESRLFVLIFKREGHG